MAAHTVAGGFGQSCVWSFVNCCHFTAMEVTEGNVGGQRRGAVVTNEVKGDE